MVTKFQSICLKFLEYFLEFLVDKKLITLKEVWDWGDHPNSRKHLPKFFQYTAAFIAHAIANFAGVFICFSILFWVLSPLALKLIYQGTPYQDVMPTVLIKSIGFLVIAILLVATQITDGLKNLIIEYSKNGRIWSTGIAWGTAIGIGFGLWLFWNIVGALTVLLLTLFVNLLIIRKLDQKSIKITPRWGY